MRALLVSALMLFSSQVFAQSEPDFDCSKLDDLPQVGLNFCAYQEFETADEALNIAWTKLRDEIQSDEAEIPEFQGWFKTALNAQRVWLSYRDSQCEAEAFSFNGGTMQPLIVSGCMKRLTDARVQEINQMMEEN